MMLMPGDRFAGASKDTSQFINQDVSSFRI
jgi:hypothetical protein